MKNQFRRKFRDLERNRPSDMIESASQIICDSIVAMDAFKTANCVGAYMSLPTEVKSDNIIAACWAAGKEVCVPYYLHEKGYYGMCRYDRDMDLKEMKWDLREPRETQPADISTIDLILVPALAFDVNGTRLGHGGGHYDRLLPGITGFKLGVAFHEQVVEELPSEPHDEPVDAVLTEQKFFHDLQ